MMPAPLPSRREPAAENAGFDYFTSEAHYRSLAQRIIAALEGDRGVVLVTSEPPASPLLLSEAINREATGRFVVIGFSGGPELTYDGLVRAVPALAMRAASLFVVDEADRLSDAQLEEIYEAVLHGDRTVAAAVLLARPGFLQRLERPGLNFLKDGFTARFHFQQLGQDEVGAFLRRQLRLAADASALPPESLAAIAEAAGGDPAVASRLAQRLLQNGGARGTAPITLAPPTNREDEEEPEPAPVGSPRERPFQLLEEATNHDESGAEDNEGAAQDESHRSNATAILGSLGEISQAITDAAGERTGRAERADDDLAASLLGHPASGIASGSPADAKAEPRLTPRQTRARRLRLAAIICAAYLAIVAAASVAVFSVLHPAPDSVAAANKREAGSGLIRAAESLLFRAHPESQQIARIEPTPTPAPVPPATADTPAPPAATTKVTPPSPPPAETSLQDKAAPKSDESAAASTTTTAPTPATDNDVPASEPSASTAALAETTPPPLPPALPGVEPPASKTAAPANVTAPPVPATVALATPDPKPPAPEASHPPAPEAQKPAAPEASKPITSEAPEPTTSEAKTTDAATPVPDMTSTTTPPAPAPTPAATPAPAPVPAPAPAAEQPAAAPPPVAPPPGPTKPALSVAEITALRARGDALLATGDIVSARLFYERAAEGGDARAALLAGQTFDPGFLARAGVRGVRGDKAQAAEWYRRASALGSAEADHRLKTLGK